MSAGEGHVSQFLKFKPSFGDFPPTFHVPTNILYTKTTPSIPQSFYLKSRTLHILCIFLPK